MAGRDEPVEADRIDIDRQRHVMEANGKVVSQFVDKTPDKNDAMSDALRPMPKTRSRMTRRPSPKRIPPLPCSP